MEAGSETVIEFTTRGAVTVATIGSDLDIASADTIERYLLEATTGHAHVVVSLARCAYVDSIGLRPLIRLAKALGDRFSVVVPPGSRPRRTFDVAALGACMHVCDSLDDAVARATKGTAAA